MVRRQVRVLLPYEVHKNAAYWSPWGEGGWSAVVVHRLGRTRARVERCNPKTQVPAPTKGWARLDEMVRRDPKLKGTDRPEQAPPEVFKDSRAHRAAKELESAAKAQPVAQPSMSLAELVRSQRPATTTDRIEKLLELAGDSSTDEDW